MFGAIGSDHKVFLTLQFRLIKIMVSYLSHQHVEFSLFLYLREHVLCNRVGRQVIFLAFRIFDLIHMCIRDRFVTGLSDRNIISIT